MSAPSSLLGRGLYFIDVLACLLFSLALALVGARFGSEQTVVVELPETPPPERAGADLPGPSVRVRETPDGPEIVFDDEPVTLAELGARLRAAPPPAVVLRPEQSLLAQVIAVADAAGVTDIQLAYEAKRAEEASP